MALPQLNLVRQGPIGGDSYRLFPLTPFGIIADSFQTDGEPVLYGAAAAPPGAGYVLKTVSATAATWQPDASGSGTVTSVGLALPTEFTVSGSPVTISGTLTAIWANEAANTVFAGPTSGGPATPTFRSLVAADIPLISLTTGVTGILPVSNGGTGDSSFPAYSTIIAGTTSTGPLQNTGPGTAGFVLTSNGAAAVPTYQAPATSGTVTSVALTAPSIFSVAGSPITTSGTLAITLTTEVANSVFAGPTSGGAAIPTFRPLVAADIPLISLTTGVTGTLPIANGGTSNTTALTAFNTLSPLTTRGDLLTRDTTNNIRLGIGTAGQVLTSDGTDASWQAPATSGTVTSVGLALPSIFSVSGSPVTSSGTLTGTLNTQTANTVFAGPASGGAATPTFRALVNADIPTTIPVNVKETEVDFGATLNQTEKLFTIIDAAVTPSSKILMNLSYVAPTGKDQDEVEMDDLLCRCIAGTGQFDVFITSLWGAVYSTFKFNYITS